MKRNHIDYIKRDYSKKLILISGPRQSGKTTLSKSITSNYQYLNYDLDEHRDIIEKKQWDRTKELLIFDEIHKMPKWKSWLKGIYDVYGLKQKIIVTGSAKLDTYRKVGDSLAGRYFLYRLFPFDLKELYANEENFNLGQAFLTLLNIGGFPEPYLSNDEDEYLRWRKTHLDIIIRQDLITLEKINNIIGIEKLIKILRQRVGSTISHKNIADDIGVDPKTIKKWLEILESLFVVFKITPYSNKIRNSLLKAPKYYFFDNGQVEGDDGQKLENLVAFSIFKELHKIEDTKGLDCSLHYLRDKAGNEIDFLILIKNKVTHLIEVKWADCSFSKSFFHYESNFVKSKKIQLVHKINFEKTHEKNIEMRNVENWLASFELLEK